MFGFFRKKPKTDYAEAVIATLRGCDFCVTNDGFAVILSHEKSGEYSWVFTSAFVYMNGVCNQLCDEVGEQPDEALSQLKCLEITLKSQAFLSVIIEDSAKTELLNEFETGFLLDLQTELITEPGTKFRKILSLGRLSKPCKI